MKKIPIWKNIVLIVSFLAVLIIATFAWFITSREGEARDFAIDVHDSSYIQISSDNGENWSGDLSLELGTNDRFKEISGNGTTLFAPVYDQIEDPDQGLTMDIVSFEPVTDTEKYYEQEFLLRSDAAHDVYLSPESYVSAVSGEENSYIAGAIRVAFFELDENDNETLKCIWAPNATVEYSADTNSFTNTGSVESSYYYQNTVVPVDVTTLTGGATSPHVTKIPTDINGTGVIPSCGYNAAYQFMWSSGNELPANAPSLLKLELSDDGTVADKRMKIKVWLEGHDRECVSAIGGQKFTMKFEFSATKGE